MAVTEGAPAGESGRWLARARAVLPGGVSSPVRAFRGVGGTPPVVRSAGGVEITDEDGNTYLDFVASWGPLILGHAHPALVEAVRTAADRGSSFGATSRPEIELAETMVACYPGIEQVRFVSSGTEAVMSAVRLARGATGRDLIVKFSGCYHGHADGLLVAAGSGLKTLGRPASAGVPGGYAELTRVLPLDDEEALGDLFEREGGRIAAVIIEPVPANNGLLQQRPEFLNGLRDACTRSGALLILDEVITGFRLGPGGAAERYGLQPDLVTFGKVIGGGLPVGAVAGPREVMRELAPEGPVYQAGTLSGNPLAMTAGLTTLRWLVEHDGWRTLETLGQELEERLGDVLRRTETPAALARIGSIFWIAWGATELPRAAERIPESAATRYAEVFHALLGRGIALAPSAYEVGFLSAAHESRHLRRFAEALDAVLADANGDAGR